MSRQAGPACCPALSSASTAARPGTLLSRPGQIWCNCATPSPGLACSIPRSAPLSSLPCSATLPRLAPLPLLSLSSYPSFVIPHSLISGFANYHTRVNTELALSCQAYIPPGSAPPRPHLTNPFLPEHRFTFISIIEERKLSGILAWHLVTNTCSVTQGEPRSPVQKIRHTGRRSTP